MQALVPRFQEKDCKKSVVLPGRVVTGEECIMSAVCRQAGEAPPLLDRCTARREQLLYLWCGAGWGRHPVPPPVSPAPTPSPRTPHMDTGTQRAASYKRGSRDCEGGAGCCWSGCCSPPSSPGPPTWPASSSLLSSATASRHGQCATTKHTLYSGG